MGKSAKRPPTCCLPHCIGTWITRRSPDSNRADPEERLLPVLARRMEQMEARLRLLEEEQRGGIDLTRFYNANQDQTP